MPGGSMRTNKLFATLFALFSLLGVLGMGTAAGAAPRAKATAAAPVLRTVNEWAASQPTAWGKPLMELRAWKGRVYAGYGDYDGNTGPIQIASIGEGDNAFQPEFT